MKLRVHGLRGVFALGLILASAILLTPPAAAQVRTQIDGEFEGCEYDKVYPLVGGLLLVCEEYNYSYSSMPEVVVIDGGRVLIDNEVYRAHVEQGQILKTRVQDEFEGCDFDKIITFDNGLLFECRTYRYHYSYRPGVMIIVQGKSYRVFIDGDEYAGVLYKR